MEKNKFDVNKADLLDMPERRKMLPPEKLLQLLPIEKNDSILDLGAGTGYFTIPAAKMTSNKVFALEPEEKLLDEILSRAKAENINNINTLLSGVENIPLQNSSVDIVIASLVLHLAESLPNAMSEISRVLKDGGYMLCFEWEKKESPIGPSLDMRIPLETMEKEITDAGLSVIKYIFPTDYLYILIIKK